MEQLAEGAQLLKSVQQQLNAGNHQNLPDVSHSPAARGNVMRRRPATVGQSAGPSEVGAGDEWPFMASEVRANRSFVDVRTAAPGVRATEAPSAPVGWDFQRVGPRPSTSEDGCRANGLRTTLAKFTSLHTSTAREGSGRNRPSNLGRPSTSDGASYFWAQQASKLTSSRSHFGLKGEKSAHDAWDRRQERRRAQQARAEQRASSFRQKKMKEKKDLDDMDAMVWSGLLSWHVMSVTLSGQLIVARPTRIVRSAG